jgi:hypothetical protein
MMVQKWEDSKFKAIQGSYGDLISKTKQRTEGLIQVK